MFTKCILLLIFCTLNGNAEKLEQGKMSQRVTLLAIDNDAKMGYSGYAGFSRTAFVGTKIELRALVRSSACHKEFAEVFEMAEDNGQRQSMYDAYMTDPSIKPPDKSFAYKTVYKYKSEESRPYECTSSVVLFQLDHIADLMPIDTKPWISANEPVEPKVHNVLKRAAPTPVTNATVPPGTGSGSFHPFVVLPLTSVYMVLVKVVPTKQSNLTITVETAWRAQEGGGYLSPIDWPLLPFYAVMSAVYAFLALTWCIVSVCQWKDLLRIQFWIGGVIILGMVEKAVFVSEYQTLNNTGQSVDGAIQLAEVVSCIKKTLSRMLVVIVSVGFGVVKPRLGSTLHKVVGLGFVYFILCAIDGVMRSSKEQHADQKQKQLVQLPLVLVDVGICWWIFSSLLVTTRALRLRRNEVKLSLYRHFTNVLIFAVVASCAFMVWTLSMHVLSHCLTNWSELWVDQAFWHVLFSVLLLVIMVLWRPTNNNQRYAFTPLLDATEDEDEEDTVFASEGLTSGSDTMKMRGVRQQPKREHREASLEDELKWVEEHIPTSITDKALPALVDSEEEIQHTRFELSKMQ